MLIELRAKKMRGRVRPARPLVHLIVSTREEVGER
jgi:hypothetical protein